ncbi:MAG TPA: FHA domain-containing protein [Myxococcota bacterium]|nr:FHA domain-containing protein [Myxococcota bacterium]
MYKLIIEDDEGRTTVVPFQRDEITIGRKEGNTIRLTERNVSRHHARFGRANSSIFVEDLDSYNGVKVNGDRITARTTLREGDLVEIGDYHLALQKVEEELAAASAPPAPPTATAPALRATARMGGPAPTTADGGTAVLRLPLEEKPPAEPSRARPLAAAEVGRLVVMTTELAGQTFALDKSEMTIGRTEDNDIVVAHRSVFSRHAKIVHDAGVYRIVDMDSANGVLVNGEEYARVDIRKGDVIELGHVKFQFMAAGEQAGGVASAPPAPRAMVDATAAEAEAQAQAGKRGLGMKLGLGLGAVAVLGVGTFLVLHFMNQGTTTEAGQDAGVAVAGGDASTGPVEGPPGPTAEPRAADRFQDGLNLMKTGEWKAAEAAFQATLALEADHKGARAMLEKVQAENQSAELLTKAKKAIDEKDWDLAYYSLNDVGEGTQSFPEAEKLKPEVQRKFIFFHLNKADLLLNGGKKDQVQEAIKHIEVVLLVEPNNFPAKEKMKKAQAMLAGRTGVKPPAVVDGGEDRPPSGGDQASKRKRAKELTEKAAAAYKKKQYREALTALQEALKLTPTNFELHRQMGTCYAMLGDQDKASVHYRKYVQLCPSCMYAPQVRKIIADFEASKK